VGATTSTAGTILACYNALADGDPEPVGPNPQHVYFSVDDLDAAHARAKEAGCSELTGIELRPWGERSFYARDLFGNPICFDSQTLFTGGAPLGAHASHLTRTRRLSVRRSKRPVIHS
jgi:uncharacterized glyoxalase superfamily protein PhnB